MLRLLTLTALLFSTITINAQTTTPSVKTAYNLPIQTFTKYPTLLGVRLENRFAHEKKFLTQQDQGLILSYEAVVLETSIFR